MESCCVLGYGFVDVFSLRLLSLINFWENELVRVKFDITLIKLTKTT